MEIRDIEHALQIFQTNLDWSKRPQAKKALMALRFLHVNRAQASSHIGSSLSFSDISSMIKQLEEKLDKWDRLSWTTARPRRF